MTKRFKIEPDLTCPELAGYKLPQIEPDGVGQPLTDYIKEKHNQAECIGFIDGYNKAREKYQFTEDDMKYIFECGRNYQNNAEVTFKVSIAHLRTPRNPIAIEVEMEYTCCKRYMNCIGCDATEDMIQPVKPATNPDGTVKGRWVYE